MTSINERRNSNVFESFFLPELALGRNSDQDTGKRERQEKTSVIVTFNMILVQNRNFKIFSRKLFLGF